MGERNSYILGPVLATNCLHNSMTIVDTNDSGSDSGSGTDAENDNIFICNLITQN